ncbi:glycosyltransferase [Flaviaesturariibacter terrae]
MNILLYENEHFETVEALLEVLDSGANNLQLLLPARLAADREFTERLRRYKVVIHALPELPAAHPAFVEKMARSVAAEALVLGTVSFRHAQFALLPRRLKIPVLLGVHDVNDLFAPAWGKTLRSWARAFGKRRLRRSVTAFAVLLDEMRAFILRQYAPPQPVVVIPGAFFEGVAGREMSTDNSIVPIVVPGSIDGRRRDYRIVLELAALLPPDEFPVRLLGAWSKTHPPGNWPPATPVSFAPEGVSAKDFDDAMRACELVWIPLQPNFRHPDGTVETYGSSKSAGAFFDALRFGKPLLVPDDLPVPSIVASALLRYSDATYLRYLLLALQANPVARRRLQLMAAMQSELIHPEDVRSRVLPLLTGGA